MGKKLEGKVAVITGGARGIGREIALTFAREGADLAILDILPAEIENIAGEIKAINRQVVARTVDVTRSESIHDYFNTVVETFGKIDILVNNAAYIHYARFLDFPEQEWDKVMAVSLKGYFLCGQAAARQMAKQRTGNIVNIASIAGEIGVPMGCAYCASKGGVIALTKLMATELAAAGVRVNAIAPGVVDTENVRRVVGADGMKMREAMVPLGRLAKTFDIAKAALFLASDDADFITGHILRVDGGFMAAAVAVR
ncbi:MAG: glucose 1-dehydrogenase [Desulfobacteraceae bacterium]|nr:MAG: glucose 1-dehydrogenase [Desulfobacteraceae bacterium]